MTLILELTLLATLTQLGCVTIHDSLEQSISLLFSKENGSWNNHSIICCLDSGPCLGASSPPQLLREVLGKFIQETSRQISCLLQDAQERCQ